MTKNNLMALFRKIHVSFWSDPFTSELDRDQKLFYLYLLTNERTSLCGIYEITKRQIGFDLGYNIDSVSKHLKYFIDMGKIAYNSQTCEVAIKNWGKYYGSESPKVKTRVNKEIEEVKDTSLIEYIYSKDTVSIPPHVRVRKKEKEKEKEKEERERVKVDEEKPPQHKLQIFIETNCPNIGKLQKQLTLEEAEKLTAIWTGLQIKEKVQNLENIPAAQLKKRYSSVYLTLRNWLNRDFPERNKTVSKPKAISKPNK
jgi:hypothetical protein